MLPSLHNLRFDQEPPAPSDTGMLGETRGLEAERHYWLKEVDRNGMRLSDVPDELKGPYMCFWATRKNPRALHYVPERFKENVRQEWIYFVMERGTNLANAPEEYKSDREIVLAAARQNPEALEYAAKSLRDDPQIKAARKLYETYGDVTKGTLSQALLISHDTTDPKYRMFLNTRALAAVTTKNATVVATYLAAIYENKHPVYNYAFHGFAYMFFSASVGWETSFRQTFDKAIKDDFDNGVKLAEEYHKMLEDAHNRAAQFRIGNIVDSNERKIEQQLEAEEEAQAKELQRRREDVRKQNRQIKRILSTVRPGGDDDSEMEDSDEEEVIPQLGLEEQRAVRRFQDNRKRARIQVALGMYRF